jgi:hypothetical protein
MNQEHSMVDARCHLHATTCSVQLNNASRSSTIDEKLIECSDNQDEENNDTIIEESKRVPKGTRVLVEDTVGQVIKNEISYHYSVDFGDETFSHDM